MSPEEKRIDTPDPTPKAPYQRPVLKRVGTLRDLTAGPATLEPTSSD